MAKITSQELDTAVQNQLVPTTGPTTLAADPTADMHAATKHYVDTKISNTASKRSTYQMMLGGWKLN